MSSTSPRSSLDRHVPERERRHRFQSRRVAERYECRPPYSDEVYAFCVERAFGTSRRLLDAGCGTGKLARRLAADFERVDAVDPSDAMLRAGRSLPDGDRPNLHWIRAGIEEAPLAPPYALATAGASFHWFDADRVLSRLADALEPGALLIVIEGDAPWRAPWEDDERALMIDFETRMRGEPPVWRRTDVESTPLVVHPKFACVEVRITEPAPFEQSVDEYLDCQHSRASFAPEVMGSARMAEFDAALREILAPHAIDDRIRYDRRTRLEAGRPLA